MMKPLILGLLVVAALPVAQGRQTFTGTITDSVCDDGNHAPMQMGPTDAECTVACIDAHGAAYVLYDGKDTYKLSDQQTPARFAGRRVTVVGSLDATTGTIQVTSIAAAQQATQPTFRGTSDAVRVFVTVTDRDGRLVTTLDQAAFEVRDEGKPQPITLFDNTPQPIRLIVMLDVSGSMEGNLQLLRAAAEQLFARLRPDDVARVGAFGSDITISPSFTHDANELRAALPDTIPPNAPTPLWRALDEALDAFGEAEPRDDDGRPVILVLSDGKDTGQPSFRERPVGQGEVIDRALRDDVMIYAIGLHSRSTRRAPPGVGTAGLRATLLDDLPDADLARVAEETGGGYLEIRAGQDLGAAFAGVADELHSQYLLGFAPPKRDGKKHDIDVRVAIRDVKPRARKSYIAPRGPRGPREDR